LAALLHDVGHAPFSHTLELVPGVNHHRFTLMALSEAPLTKLLKDIDTQHLETVLNGTLPSALKNRFGAMQVDHLDSWMRGGQALGLLDFKPNEWLNGLRWSGDHLEADRATGERLAHWIFRGAASQLQPLDMAAHALVAQLIGELIDVGEFAIPDLRQMIDAEITFTLMRHPRTRDRAYRLFMQPHGIRFVRPKEGAAGPPGSILIEPPRLYLDLPWVDGVSLLHRYTDQLERLKRRQTRLAVWISGSGKGHLAPMTSVNPVQVVQESKTEIPRKVIRR
jgi:uncharacterized protein